MRPTTAEAAAKDIAGHELTVIHDAGLHKHLLYRNPASSEFWFTITTAPGTLTVHGDMGTYVFARETDMISWFLGSSWRGEPNVDYWAEKCASTGGRRGLKEYSETALRQCIESALRDEIECEGLTVGEAAVLRHDATEFLHGYDLSDPPAYVELGRFTSGGRRPFSGSYEWDPYEYTYQYVWTAHTLLAALQAYREQVARQPALLAPAPLGDWEGQPPLRALFESLGKSAAQQPEYRQPAAIMGYTEGVEHALDSLWAKGYRDVSELVSAWTNPGPMPQYHRQMQQQLSHNWPTLCRAITNITSTTKGPTK